MDYIKIALKNYKKHPAFLRLKIKNARMVFPSKDVKIPLKKQNWPQKIQNGPKKFINHPKHWQNFVSGKLVAFL